MLRRGAVGAALAALFVVGGAQADEGLWTYDAFPFETMRRDYGFAPDQAWLDHVRMGSVRIRNCSAALVSENGLVQTNHHCVADCIDSLSQPGQDLNLTPIIAPTLGDERTCPGQTADVLMAMEDVTARIVAAGEARPQDRDAARREEIARIAAECSNPAEHRLCEVVSLFAGAKYTLHVYRRWLDVRMVLGPEMAAGSFGGDPDNFNFPRYAFDVAFLRLYEDGAPARTPNRLKWRSEPLTEGEPVFVSGHPGFTGRDTPVAVIDYYLDTYFPWSLVTSAELRGRLIAYAARGVEQARVTSAMLAEVENSFKAEWAERSALQGNGVLSLLRRREAELKAKIVEDAALNAAVGDAWERIEAAQAVNRELFNTRVFLGDEAARHSDLFQLARAILRWADEREKPEEERLAGFHDGDMPALRDYIADDTPPRLDKEEIALSFWLAKMREFMTADHPLVTKVLGKESPEGMAARLVAATRIGDRAERLRLFDGGKAAVDASDDPMIVLVRSIDAEARQAEHRRRTEVTDVTEEAMRRVSAARFVLAPRERYPDATGTLRVTYGRVQGWTEPDGRVVAPFTRLAGLFERATGAEPFRLAPAWVTARERLSPDTIFNVATTNDTIGGNSGSPAVDREGRVVGAMFDGNIHSLGGFYLFDSTLNRSVLIASTGIEEALVKVYGLQRLVDELRN